MSPSNPSNPINPINPSNRLLRALPFFILTVFFTFVYFETIKLIVEGWFLYTISHGLLMFGLSMFMIWKKRAYLRRLESRPEVILGSLLTAVGCITLISGRLSITPTVEKISVIVTLLGLVLLLGGSYYLRVLYIPICYLIFTIPVFDTILADQLIYFQGTAATIAASVLPLIGIPVFRSGHVMTLPHITLDVARGCSGVNHIMALVGLAIPLAFVTQKTRWRRIALVIEAFIIGILANGLRIAAIGFWTFFDNNVSVHGPADIFLVSFIFGFGFVSLIFLSTLQGRISLKTFVSQPIQEELSSQERTRKQAYPALIVASSILCATGGYLFFHTTEPFQLKADLKKIPMLVGSWLGEDIYKGSVKAGKIHPDSELRRTYRNPNGSEIHIYVGYFNKQSEGRKVFDSEYASHRINSKAIDLLEDSNGVLELSHKKSDRGDSYMGYIVDDKLVSKPFMAKMATIKSTMLKGRNNAGIIIIETEENLSSQGTVEGADQEADFIRDIVLQVVTMIIDPIRV